MADRKITVRVDTAADAAYVRLGDAPVVRTVELSDTVLVDLDAEGRAVGFELLTLAAQVPGELEEKFDQLTSEVLPAVLRMNTFGGPVLRPGADGTARPMTLSWMHPPAGDAKRSDFALAGP